MSLLMLVALEAERAPLLRHLAGRGELRWAVTGMGPRRAAAAARRLGPPNRLLVSTGCCGSLRAGASPGVLVIPRQVLLEARVAPPPSPDWVEAALTAARRLALPVDDGPLLSVASPLRDPESKTAAAARTGAAAVDMETGAIATVAAALGLPYLAARVVLDTVDETLPGAGGSSAGLSMKALLERLDQVSDGLGRCLAELIERGDPGAEVRTAPPR